jgi:hypothetical protein
MLCTQGWVQGLTLSVGQLFLALSWDTDRLVISALQEISKVTVDLGEPITNTENDRNDMTE